MRILRVLGSRLLRCGCFVGVYETYGGSTVEIVDEVSDVCHDPRHRPGEPLTFIGSDSRSQELQPREAPGIRASRDHF